MRKPAPLPTLRCAEQAAWTTGWWAGIVIGVPLGFGLAVICGLVR